MPVLPATVVVAAKLSAKLSAMIAVPENRSRWLSSALVPPASSATAVAVATAMAVAAQLAVQLLEELLAWAPIQCMAYPRQEPDHLPRRSVAVSS